MTRLIVTPDTAPNEVLVDTEKLDEIAETLEAVGRPLRAWNTDRPIAPDASDVDVLAAFADDIDRVNREGRLRHRRRRAAAARRRSRTTSGTTKSAGAPGRSSSPSTRTPTTRYGSSSRAAEPFTSASTARFTSSCASRAISWGFPAGTRHWFDMGTDPGFAALRFFREPEGWVGSFTGDDIATRFPSFDRLIA